MSRTTKKTSTIGQSTVGIGGIIVPEMNQYQMVQAPAALPGVQVQRTLSQILLTSTYKGARLSEEQVAYLSAITWPLTSKPLLSLENPQLTYEIFCFVVGDAFNERVVTLGAAMELFPDNGKSTIILGTPVFDKEKDIYLSEIERMRSSASMVQGEEQCVYCLSWNTRTASIQNRSADEATASITYCFSCNKKKVSR